MRDSHEQPAATSDAVRWAFEAQLNPGDMRAGPPVVLTAVQRAFGVTRGALSSERRSHDIAHARQAAMLLLAVFTGRSIARIGVLLCRDHTTVLHGMRAAAQRMAADELYRLRIEHAAVSIVRGTMARHVVVAGDSAARQTSPAPPKRHRSSGRSPVSGALPVRIEPPDLVTAGEQALRREITAATLAYRDRVTLAHGEGARWR